MNDTTKQSYSGVQTKILHGGKKIRVYLFNLNTKLITQRNYLFILLPRFW